MILTDIIEHSDDERRHHLTPIHVEAGTREWRSLRDRLDIHSMPVTECGCQVWLKWCSHGGYGRIMVLGKVLMAHRLSFAVHKGPIPDGLLVLHRCDVRPCINPDHLFLGDQVLNMADMTSKGQARYLFGSDCPPAKLSEPEVIAIKADRRLQREIADSYGVSVPTISMIKSGKRWSHIRP